MRRRIWVPLVLLVAAGAVVTWRAVGVASPPPATATAGSAGPIPVVIGTVEQRDQPIWLTGIGTVQAYNTVQIHSRVDGQIQEIRFKEGQEVKAGDVLAVLDSRPFTASLKQFEAAKLKDQALLANARADLERFQALSKREFATRQSVDTQQALIDQTIAQIAADEAMIEGARTQLAYCTITAPIAGRTGLRQVDLGNIVHAADTTPLVMLTQLEPISVVFTLPGDLLPQIAKDGSPMVVSAYAKDNRTVLATGTLDLVDNQIDSQTGTVKLKATFANRDRGLWPGQFVNARLLSSTRHDAVLVPASVIQRGPSTAFAWVVKAGVDKAGETVEMRPLTLGPVQDGIAVIESGLKPGERVVVDGQYKLQPGSAVIAAPG